MSRIMTSLSCPPWLVLQFRRLLRQLTQIMLLAKSFASIHPAKVCLPCRAVRAAELIHQRRFSSSRAMRGA